MVIFKEAGSSNIYGNFSSMTLNCRREVLQNANVFAFILVNEDNKPLKCARGTIKYRNLLDQINNTKLSEAEAFKKLNI